MGFDNDFYISEKETKLDKFLHIFFSICILLGAPALMIGIMASLSPSLDIKKLEIEVQQPHTKEQQICLERKLARLKEKRNEHNSIS